MDFYKILKCTKCGSTFPHPWRDTYYYKDIDTFHFEYPQTQMGYCNDCKKFVCVQKGIKTDELKKKIDAEKSSKKAEYIKLLSLLKGRNSVDSCTECQGTDIDYSFECPICHKGLVASEDTENKTGIMFHVGRTEILPVLEKEDVELTSNDNKPETRKAKKISVDIYRVVKIFLFIIALFIAYLFACNGRYYVTKGYVVDKWKLEVHKWVDLSK